MADVRSVTLDIASAQVNAARGTDAVVSVKLVLTLRDAGGKLRERSVILTPPEATSIDSLAGMLPDLIASVRSESFVPPVHPPEVDDVLVLDSFDFNSLTFEYDR